MAKGLALNVETFIKDNKYDVKFFVELLERIQIIKVSEGMPYQKNIDLFIVIIIQNQKKHIHFLNCSKQISLFSTYGSRINIEKAYSNKNNMSLIILKIILMD